MLLGIPPARPETGFGYLKLSRRAAPGYGSSVHRVEQFTEKPDLKKAKRFLASGRYAWNAGIFVWYASTFLANLRKHLPRTAKLLAAGEKHWGKRTRKSWLARTYPQLENISVDYGVMEKASRVYAVEAPIGWSDVGSWQAVYRQQKKDRAGSVLPAASIAFDSKGNYIAAEGKVRRHDRGGGFGGGRYRRCSARLPPRPLRGRWQNRKGTEKEKTNGMSLRYAHSLPFLPWIFPSQPAPDRV